ncbi:Uncharacterised protein [Streptococcus suis]|uniref:Uncharacterized protein n=2 Tax=Streptococcus TaxID=1301 RepID=A0A0Z9APM5_STRSU|nr:hypothetical protein SSU10_01840 [Streptococcus suis]CYT61158.1 Uncharacterised protein [Streptococcus suis]CYT61169.1 Uncharacterised protein [Streptococcus suis]CYT62312.1 Uncharacterised protein [Streptococcus suis]CYT69961.1 Uncharacterised protein [Streptococcus suis]
MKQNYLIANITIVLILLISILKDIPPIIVIK